MELAKELIMAFKQNNKSRMGYGYQKECEALVSHVLNNMTRSNFPTLNSDVKNEKDSIKYREEGNEYFVTGDDIKAIEFYTKSLAYANTEELMSYARANRSAALYRKQMYVDCLIDINAALSLGYPQAKAEKLKERGQKALSQIKELLKNSESDEESPSKIAEILEDLHQWEDNNKKENGTFVNGIEAEKKSEKQQALHSVEDIKKSIDIKSSTEVDNMSSISSVSPVPRYLENYESPSLTYGTSKEAPAASKGLHIEYNAKYGRHIVATKTFRPGDIVSVEKPYAYVVYKERYYTHCQHCLTRSYNLIPCPHCPLILYCSEKCKSAAWKAAHSTECSILIVLTNLLNIDQDKIKILTKIMRLMIELTSNGSAINKLREDMKTAETNPDLRSAGFTDERIFDSDSSRSALSLETNLEIRPLTDISAFACISSLTTILLATQSHFFGKKYPVNERQDINKKDDVIFCTSLMFRACVIMSSNSFSIQINPGIKCGSGLYVFHSLLNHTCAPNTMRQFEGLTMITRALIPIESGDQVFTSYCGGYQYAPRSERQKKLIEDYFFECDCPACVFDWPTYTEIINKHLGSISNKKEILKKMSPIKARLRENKYDIEAIKCGLEILFTETKMPCEEMVIAMQYLKSYYLGKFK